MEKNAIFSLLQFGVVLRAASQKGKKLHPCMQVTPCKAGCSPRQDLWHNSCFIGGKSTIGLCAGYRSGSGESGSRKAGVSHDYLQLGAFAKHRQWIPLCLACCCHMVRS